MPAQLAIALCLLLPAAASARSRAPVRSMIELRQQGVVQQGYDLSCGAAALSTLLNDLGDPVSEPEVVEALLRHADPKRIRKQGGFTLLDLKRYSTARGYAAEGYANLDLGALVGLGTAIVPTVNQGRPHFLVFRGVEGDRVVLADPAYGNRTMTRARFEAIWTPRIAFAVRRPSPPAAVVAATPPAGASP